MFNISLVNFIVFNLLLQLVFLFFLVLVMFGVFGSICAYSVGFGGFISWLSNLCMMRLTFGPSNLIKKVLSRLYIAEIVKWVLAFSLLSMVFMYMKWLDFRAVLLGFGFILFINGFMPLFFKFSRK